MTVAGLFRSQLHAQQALEALRGAGFATDDLTLVASPTSAVQLAPDAALAQEYETRVAQGDVLLCVAARDPRQADVAQLILRQHRADRVSLIDAQGSAPPSPSLSFAPNTLAETEPAREGG